MGPLLERLPSGSRIAVIRLRSLGDCVLTTPALALLKAHRPDLRLAVVVEDRFRGVFEDSPDVGELLAPRRDTVAAWRPHLVLNLHGGTPSMAMTIASRAKYRVGFGHHSYSFVYSAKIPRAQEIFGEERPVHTAEHMASAMFWLGVPRGPIPRAKLIAGATPAGNYAVIHPFASRRDKTWPAERFLAVAQYLRESGLDPVFLAGPSDDAAAFRKFRVLENAPLAEIKSLMAGAQLFVGNDSGPAHMAAAFGVPVVVLFGSSNPVTWAPWRTEARVLTARAGIDAIEVEQVIESVQQLRKVSA
jgi:ADP-heptose:LPS heptosyltransferase